MGIAGCDDVVIADGAAGLCDVFDAAAVCALDIVAEGEEGVGAQGHVGVACKPCFLFFSCEDSGLLGEEGLPLAVIENVHVFLSDIEVDSVVAVRAADAFFEGKVEDLGALAQIPVVGLLTGKACAVDTGLLAGADADGLAALDEAYGVGLGILEGDEGDRHIIAGCGGQVFVLSHNVGEKSVVDNKLIAALFKSDTVDLLLLDGSRNVVGIHLQDAVVALLFALEDLQGVVVICGGDDAVGDFGLDQVCGAGIALVGQGDEITEAGHSVRAAGTCVGTCEGSKLSGILYPVDLFLHLSEGKADGRACRGNMLKRCRRGLAGRFFELFDELIAVEGIKQVDVAGTAVEYGDGKFLPVFHIDAGRFLIGIASVFELKFFHF